MSKILNTLMVLIISLVTVILLLTGACKTKTPAIITQTPAIITQPVESQITTFQGIVPYIPPAYYQCTEVLPTDLEKAFYSNYANTYVAGEIYDGQVFVFKNMIVNAWMTREVDKGWLWADNIKCPIVNLDDAKKLESGEKVDIVGICVGRDLQSLGGLLFKDCYVLKSGSVQLPAPGGGSAFTPGY